MIHPMDESWAIAHLKRERDDYKTQRDTLIDDIAVLKANISRLEHENKALRLQADTYFDEWQELKKNYTTLTDHIRLKAENNPGVSRYIDLVNFIKDLECD